MRGTLFKVSSLVGILALLNSASIPAKGQTAETDRTAETNNAGTNSSKNVGGYRPTPFMQNRWDAEGYGPARLSTPKKGGTELSTTQLLRRRSKPGDGIEAHFIDNAGKTSKKVLMVDPNCPPADKPDTPDASSSSGSSLPATANLQSTNQNLADPGALYLSADENLLHIIVASGPGNCFLKDLKKTTLTAEQTRDFSKWQRDYCAKIFDEWRSKKKAIPQIAIKTIVGDGYLSVFTANAKDTPDESLKVLDHEFTKLVQDVDRNRIPFPKSLTNITVEFTLTAAIDLEKFPRLNTKELGVFIVRPKATGNTCVISCSGKATVIAGGVYKGLTVRRTSKAEFDEIVTEFDSGASIESILKKHPDSNAPRHIPKS